MLKFNKIKLIFIQCVYYFILIPLLILLLTLNSYAITTTKQSIDSQKLISLQFNHAPIKAILQALAEQQQLNLIMIDPLEENLSLSLTNVAWQQAVSIISELTQLDIKVKSGLMIVMSKQQQPLSLLPLPIQHHDANAIMDMLNQQKGNLLSERGQISVDDTKNYIYIYDLSSNFKKIIQFVEHLDKPQSQIQITAHIVTMSHDGLEELGIKWGLASHKKLGIDHIETHFPSSSGAIAGFNLATLQGRLLSLELSAMEQENEVNIIASPQLLTRNNESATIKQGTELPYEIATNSHGGSAIEFKSAVLGLEVTPKILANGKINLSLIISQNTPGQTIKQSNGGEVLAINTQEIKTQVIVTDNETLVLGGVFQQNRQHLQQKIPWFTKIPLISSLFGYQKNTLSKRELIIFITPTIINGDE